MSARHTSARTIRRALAVLLELPAEAQALLAEQLIERIDAAGPDPDVEEDNEDGCDAEDVPLSGHHGTGDADDAEEDNQDRCEASDDDPATSQPSYGYHGQALGCPEDGEPSLGWPEDRANCLVASGSDDDRELDTADDEPDADAEPSGGSALPTEEEPFFPSRPYIVRLAPITRRGRPVEPCELPDVGRERRLAGRECGA